MPNRIDTISGVCNSYPKPNHENFGIFTCSGVNVYYSNPDTISVFDVLLDVLPAVDLQFNDINEIQRNHAIGIIHNRYQAVVHEGTLYRNLSNYEFDQDKIFWGGLNWRDLTSLSYHSCSIIHQAWIVVPPVPTNEDMEILLMKKLKKCLQSSRYWRTLDF